MYKVQIVSSWMVEIMWIRLLLPSLHENDVQSKYYTIDTGLQAESIFLCIPLYWNAPFKWDHLGESAFLQI